MFRLLAAASGLIKFKAIKRITNSKILNTKSWTNIPDSLSIVTLYWIQSEGAATPCLAILCSRSSVRLVPTGGNAHQLIPLSSVFTQDEWTMARRPHSLHVMR